MSEADIQLLNSLDRVHKMVCELLMRPEFRKEMGTPEMDRVLEVFDRTAKVLDQLQRGELSRVE